MKFKNTLRVVVGLFMGIMILVQVIFCCTLIYQKKTLKMQIKQEMESEYGLVRVAESYAETEKETIVTGIPAIAFSAPEEIIEKLGAENEVNLVIQLSSYVATSYPDATEAVYINDTWQASEALKVFCCRLNNADQTALQVIFDNTTGLFTIRTVAEAEAERAAIEESEALARAESEAAAQAEAESKAAESKAQSKAQAEAESKKATESKAN